MQMRTMLGRVRGLGSAKEGVQHWWMQRVTAVFLVPLLLWLVFNIVRLAGADHAAVAAWLASPINGGLLVLLLVAGFYHMKLGLQVVIEDYLHNEGAKLAALIAVKGVTALLGIISVMSVLKLVFGR